MNSGHPLLSLARAVYGLLVACVLVALATNADLADRADAHPLLTALLFVALVALPVAFLFRGIEDTTSHHRADELFDD